MKWIGQHIYDLVSRFRNDVYLEDISTGTIASGAHLGLDSNNKIVKAVDGGGDLTSIVPGTGLSGTSLTGPIPTLNVDATQAGITGLGTITSGTWQSTTAEIESAYLDPDTAHLTTAQTFTGSKTFSDVLILDGDRNYGGEAALLHLDNSTITDTSTSASGTAARFKTVGIEHMTVAATNSSVTTTNAASLYISAAPVAGTNMTLTNSWALWVDSGNVRLDNGLKLDNVLLSGVQTSSEPFANNDTSIMTSAAIDDAIIKGGSTTFIKVLPYNFMSNEDGGANKSVQFRDDTIIGVRATADNSELYAFVEIPIGKTATAVIVYGNDSGNVVEVFESDINAGALTDKTHASGCVVGTACDITDVAADTTNYLVIKVTITSYTNDIVYGAVVTISG